MKNDEYIFNYQTLNVIGSSKSLKRNRVIILFFFLFLLSGSTTYSQNSLVVVNYSRATQSFDRVVPFGEAFHIKGYIPSNIQAVKIESFGFLKDQLRNEELRPFILGASDSDGRTFCAGIAKARNMGMGSNGEEIKIPYTNLAWERQTGNPNATQFTINHPQLYFGRTYIFLVTYYQEATSKDVQKLEEVVRNVIKTELSGKENEKIIESLASVRKTLQYKSEQGGCDGQSVLKYTLEPTFGIFFNDLKDVLEDQIEQNEIDEKGFVKLLVAYLEDSVKKQPYQAFFEEIKGKSTLEGLNEVLNMVIGIDGLNKKDSAVIKDVNKKIESYKTAQEPVTFENAADEIVRLLKSNKSEILTKSSVTPYLENIEAQNKFLVSLDGGLVYVADFEQLIPTVGFNLKLNPVDFNDPYNMEDEWSVVVAFGMSSPDDLDPDYEGIFSGSNRSLLTGIGLRIPEFSKLIRFQTGGLWYRQQSSNPLINDYSTEVSWYFGVSLNWDTIDFASKLFNNKSSVNFN